MTDPLTYLTAALDAAQRDAEAANGRYWVDAEGDDDSTAWVMNEDMHLFETDPATARHAANNSPQATLRRIAADRKMLEAHRAVECKEFACDCDDCCAACRWTESRERGTEPASGYPDPHIYPCPTVRNMAEGWGWTEETT